MGFIRDSVRDKTRNAASALSASKNYVEWYNESLNDRLNKGVEKLGPTDKLQGGKMYRFTYTPITKDIEWYDYNPLIISLGQTKFPNGPVEAALNLNLLPYDIKIAFMDELYYRFDSIIESQIDGRRASEAKNQFPLNITWDSILPLVDKYYLGVAFRNYNRKNMVAASCISYEYWDNMLMIETYKFKNFSIGSVEKKYKEYIINRKKNKKKKK